jgi:hypothetical protein
MFHLATSHLYQYVLCGYTKMSICSHPEYYPLDHISVWLHIYVVCPYVISTLYPPLEE